MYAIQMTKYAQINLIISLYSYNIRFVPFKLIYVETNLLIYQEIKVFKIIKLLKIHFYQKIISVLIKYIYLKIISPVTHII